LSSDGSFQGEWWPEALLYGVLKLQEKIERQTIAKKKVPATTEGEEQRQG
jgi:NADH:ubiquinone oxidoreductase subunit B-like Fe-S oxidoreductase